jgi:protein gp37
MAKTKIEWCRNKDGSAGETWNPISGCGHASIGCTHCYAERMASRFSGPGMPFSGFVENSRWTGRVELIPDKLEEPLHWKKPRRIFVNSMSDLFHENLPDETIGSIFEIMCTAEQHTYLILTKRPQNMLRFMTKYTSPGGPLPPLHHMTHIWLGVSISTQEAADRNIPLLLKTPAARRFVSLEPILEHICLHGCLHEHCCNPMRDDSLLHEDDCEYPEKPGSTLRRGIDLVIAGSESGPHRRPAEIDWFRSLRDQCVAADVPYFLKQMDIDGKLVKMPKLDGVAWDQMPKGRP